MRIGLVTGEFPPMEGGVGAYTRELARGLADLNHEIHIITSREARPEMGERRIATLREPIELEFYRLHPRIGRWRGPSLATVADIVLRFELDVVNIQYQAAAYNMRSPAVNFLPWRLKGMAKTAVTFHDLRVPYLFPKAGRLRRTAVNFMARQAHGVIVTNKEDQQLLMANGQLSIANIPIGSNIQTHERGEAQVTAVRQQFGLAGGDCLLGYFGFLNESKGAETLVAALAQLPERFHLVFIGGQTGASDSDNNRAYLDELKEQIMAAGLDGRVHWTGFVDDKAVSTYLHAADVMVMPYRDGVSLRRGTLMAVMAHGRPLITTHPTVETPEIKHGDNCWLMSPGDAVGLAAAVKKLAGEPALRQQIGDGARATAALFSWERIARETAEFFEKLLTA